ncbi:hypothetical protein BJX70DRAFT_407270 [Aspergillus crustosus]
MSLPLKYDVSSHLLYITNTRRSINRDHRPLSAKKSNNNGFNVRTWERSARLRCNYFIVPEFIEAFFVDARLLIERDAESMQDVIRYMSKEHGLRYIQQLVERELEQIPVPSKHDIFRAQMVPFLEAISHPKVLSSLVAEHALGIIYNFIYGICGTRAKILIASVCSVLETLPEDDETRADWLEVSLAVLSRIIFVNTSAFVQTELGEHIIKLEKILASMDKGIMARKLHMSRKYLGQLLCRIEAGAQMPTPSSLERHSQVITLVPLQEPPGGRHNNDHMRFTSIQIMPTMDEILSPRAEYLPERDPSRWHIGGLEGLLDRNFRLLREDSVGILRDTIHQVIKESQGGIRQSEKSGQRINVYRGAKITKSYIHWSDGLLFQVEFPQPRNLRRMSPRERQTWWAHSKRLQTGALVCLTISAAHAVFCKVVYGAEEWSQMDEKRDRSYREKSRTASLWENAEGASIILTAVGSDENIVRSVFDRFCCPNQSFLMAEFPGVLLPGFEPTLQALQKINESHQLPFENFLVTSAGPGQTTVPPPLYALREGFQFNLRCLTTDDTDFFVHPDEPLDARQLSRNSSLDESQARALVSSLQRCISLIQGPPGTGKSYTGIALIKVLLANKGETGGNIGPILCVAYTNHALDQLLESLLNHDITTNIVRIGSQSKSEKLHGCNLRNVVKIVTKTREEKHLQACLRSELQTCEETYNRLSLREIPETKLAPYLYQHHSDHFKQLFGDGETNEGRINLKRSRAIIKSWLTSGPMISDSFSRSTEDLNLVNVHNMTRAERSRVHQLWLEHLAEATRSEAAQLVSTHSNAKHAWDRIRSEVDLRCLAEADVIGVTTSGLARNLEMLQKLQSKVVICEEAGEVLEAHLLTALLPSVEQAILIGDHLQLRPQVQNYGLSRDNHNGGDRYSLDVSLFERLVNAKSAFGMGLPYTTLETQRRMHPSIARLVRNTLYHDLKDSHEVTNYPEVSGMKKRLFWLDHRSYEEGTGGDAVTTSHWNAHELDMTVALVNHLLSQGVYKTGDIAVITPYLGQLYRLRQKLGQLFAVCLDERDEQEMANAGLELGDSSITTVKSNMLDTLRVATVDNFQGEEAKIIVISLVRSNPQNRCGFLSTANRVNVLLSRAQHGMYIFGNSETSAHVEMWAQVVQMLKDEGNFGQSIGLKCPRHPGKPISVSEPSHFLQLSPEGGCNFRCTKRLGCGHACESRCHSEMLHNAVLCRQPCTRVRQGCTHPCPELCGSPCPYRFLECGHLTEVLQCYQDQDPTQVLCGEVVKKTVLSCKHEVFEPCHLKVATTYYKCKTLCGVQLPCGHACMRQCYECHKTEVVSHGDCRQRCGRNYSTCVHPCPPCNAACEARCNHSRCTRKCFEPCTPCAEQTCMSACAHSVCTMPCAAPCNHIPCSRRCEKKLRCGHRCPSVCGEQCPPARFCQICALDEIANHQVDFIDGQVYREVNLDKSPCIFPRCGHFLTIESMDGQMDLKKYYSLDNFGKPIAIRDSPEPFRMEDIKNCALCRGHLRDVSRYGRLVRQAILDESTKKLILYINREYVPLAGELANSIQLAQSFPYKQKVSLPGVIRIGGPCSKQVEVMKSALGNVSVARWGGILKLRKRIDAYGRQVSPDQQPFTQVLNVVETARRGCGVSTRNFDSSRSVIHVKGTLLATALSIRLHIALLTDFMRMKGRTRAKMIMCLDENHKQCELLIKMAQESKRPPLEAEGYLFLAQFHALERCHCVDATLSSEHLNLGRAALEKARSIVAKYPEKTRGLESEIEGADNMFLSTFYAVVTNAERLSVVQAMASEFVGTGHWYYCQNGHPFTIGECGGPMQQSSCPECGAPVGGQRHRVVEGVRRADELESATS